MNTKSAYNKIMNYCNIKQIDVMSSNTWYALPEENVISHVWKGKPTKTWVYSMLHELGHIKLYNKKNYSRKNWKIIKERPFDKPNIVASAQHMREEIEAWEEGLSIAKFIKLDIDREDYDKFSAPCIMTYMKVLSKPHQNKKINNDI